jgi:hypothetical protein
MREELRSGGSTSQADYERSMMQRMIEMKLDDASESEPPKQSAIDPDSAAAATTVDTPTAEIMGEAAEASSPIASNVALSLEMEPAIPGDAATANSALELEPVAHAAEAPTLNTAGFITFDAFSVAQRAPFYLDWYRWTPSYFNDVYWDRIAAISEPDAQ